MSMHNDYVVEVKSAPREDPAVVTERLAEVLKLSREKAAVLAARMPGVITKPLPEERALRVVLRLQSVGLAAVHRRATAPGADGPAAVGTPAPVAESGPAPVAEPGPAPAAESGPAPAAATAPGGPAEAASEPPTEPPAEAATEPPAEPPSLAADDAYVSPQVRNPTGFDQIPSLDATRIDEPPHELEPDPKLTPMSEAGFGAADIMLPVDDATRRRGNQPAIVEAGPLSRPAMPPRVQAEPSGAHDDGVASDDDADPTMIVPPAAEPAVQPPPAPRYARHTPAPSSGSRNGATPAAPAGPGASSRLRDAIARDRDRGGPPKRPTLTEDELDLTPAPDVAYRSTRSAAERPLTPTPPPDEALQRSGVGEDQLSASRERRRGRFGRRLSALVALPVTLSWLLSAGFIYLLLPADLRPELWIPLAAATAIAALSGALAAALATTRITGDVTRLRDDAEHIAMGDLSSPVRVRRDDELGDVAASVDRLRVSLQEALERLRKRR